MEYRIAESEYRFMNVLWAAEPVKSMELVKLCEEKMGWKKSTTFTVIKNLTVKGYVINEHSVVRTLINKELVQKVESQAFLERTFNGNLIGMIEILLNRKLKPEEIEYIKKMMKK